MDEAKKTFLTGFSGGADSTAALLFLLENMADSGRIVAVHFNHHLRGAESDAEAENAAAFAAAHHVEFRLIDLDLAPGGNLEARARQSRLENWKKLCREYENPVVVTGHHRDDCIENLFLRIGRGSNASGLTGLRSCSEVEGVKFYRPLLHFSRADIENFLRDRGIRHWANDSSNSSCDYARNVLRNRILPELYRLFPGGSKAVGHTLDHLTCDAEFLDSEARKRYEESDLRHSISFWQEQPRAIKVRMLKLLCREFFEDDRPLSAGAVAAFENMLSNRSGGICILDEKRSLLFAGGALGPYRERREWSFDWEWRKNPVICVPGLTIRAETTVQSPGEATVDEAFFNAAQLPDILTVATVRPGEKLIPFGRKTPVLLKKLRVDQKIPAVLSPPAVKAAETVIWYPGVRHSSFAPAGKNSTIIRFFAEKK